MLHIPILFVPPGFLTVAGNLHDNAKMTKELNKQKEEVGWDEGIIMALQEAA